LSRSPHVDALVSAPGSDGIAEFSECRAVDANDARAVADLADELDADLVVVGPEEPLVNGAAGAVRERGRLAFGPGTAAATLEGSKVWMKDVLVAAGVPTARHATFEGPDAADAAFAFLETLPGLYVIKTDGLAGGKGVIVTESMTEAREAARAYLTGNAFGDAGKTCVIEEGLTGPELSVFALCDGRDAFAFAAAQDHKRAFDNDEGANTGGMGAYSPVPFAPDDLVDEVMDRAIRPTLADLARRDAEYRGVLYCGLMLTPAGIKVIEYNIRFGDPECQVLMPRLASDIYVHCLEAASGRIETPVRMHGDACIGIVLAAEGYPPAPLRKGDVIEGVDAASAVDGVQIFHSGARREGDDLVTNGGRVLTLTARAPSIKEARDRGYEAAAKISWPGLHYRRDIGAQALSHTE
jgi:phosphoribosylamine--glycine ligase